MADDGKMFSGDDSKKIAAGAVVGALIAIPVPFIGPLTGALVGGGLVALRRLLKR